MRVVLEAKRLLFRCCLRLLPSLPRWGTRQPEEGEGEAHPKGPARAQSRPCGSSGGRRLIQGGLLARFDRARPWVLRGDEGAALQSSMVVGGLPRVTEWGKCFLEGIRPHREFAQLQVEISAICVITDASPRLLPELRRERFLLRRLKYLRPISRAFPLTMKGSR
jgi:hypothetical protein